MRPRVVAAQGCEELEATLHVVPELAEFPHDLREDPRIRRDHLAAVEVLAVAGEVADEAARFEHEQAARRDVPGIEPDFPESVVEAGGDVRQIEGCGARPPDAGRALDHAAHHREVRLEVPAVAERKPGPDQAVAQVLPLADAISEVSGSEPR